MTIIYHFLVNREFNLRSFLWLFTYFLLFALLSSFSIYMFPISSRGDDILYLECGKIYSQFIENGILWNFPESNCLASPKNHFVKLIGYIYYLGGQSFLVSINWFFMFVAVDLTIKSFGGSSKANNSILKYSIFLPPFFYMGLRPAKEAAVTLMIAATFYFFSKILIEKRKWLIPLIITFVVFGIIRWQYSFAALIAFAFVLGFSLLHKTSIAKRYLSLIFILGFSIGTLFIFKDHILTHLYSNYFNPNSVEVFSKQENGAMVYKLMTYGEGIRPLNAWNVLIANTGNLVTPHPLRFIKESIRGNQFKYHIFEEFIFVSFWFFLIFPFFIICVKEKIFDLNNQKLDLNHLFKLVFTIIVFFFSSMTLFYHTPQSFRYKLPLNIFLFISVMIFLNYLGKSGLKRKLQQYKIFFLIYIVGLSFYSIIYFY